VLTIFDFCLDIMMYESSFSTGKLNVLIKVPAKLIGVKSHAIYSERERFL